MVSAEVKSEVEGVSPEVQRVQAALDGLGEARARLNELLAHETSPVVFELHAAVLATIKRLLSEMDLDARVRRQLQTRHSGRPLLQRPATRLVGRRHGEQPPTDVGDDEPRS
jgi:hypothetical protein